MRTAGWETLGVALVWRNAIDLNVMDGGKGCAKIGALMCHRNTEPVGMVNQGTLDKGATKLQVCPMIANPKSLICVPTPSPSRKKLRHAVFKATRCHPEQ